MGKFRLPRKPTKDEQKLRTTLRQLVKLMEKTKFTALVYTDIKIRMHVTLKPLLKRKN